MTNAYLSVVMTLIRFQLSVENWIRRVWPAYMAFCHELARIGERLARGVIRMAIAGLALNVLAHFWPELPSQIPVIYGFCDGMLELVEFAFKAVFGLFWAVFTGQFISFWADYESAVQALFQQAGNWLASLHF